MSKKAISVDQIAAKASRGQDISSHFTNKFAVVQPIERPRAISARYDSKTRLIVVHLSSKLIISFSPHDVEGLENARPSQLKKIQISPTGRGIHFPAIDADIYIPGLLLGLMGSRKWMAARTDINRCR